MTDDLQYVGVKFKTWDQRVYTYHNDGDPVAPGDQVDVMTRDGKKAVEVVEVSYLKPSFATKAIMGKVTE